MRGYDASFGSCMQSPAYARNSDEVHAYDTYMTTLMESLLRWLAAILRAFILVLARIAPAAHTA